MRSFLIAAGALAQLVGCSNLSNDPPPDIIHARFDPDAGIIPMPTDVLRKNGRLDLPNDSDADRAKLNDAELEFYDYLETLDGWSSLMSATVEFTAPIDPHSIDDGNLQVWHWTGAPSRVTDVRLELSDDGKVLQIDPPRTGWRRGDRYTVVLRGGVKGVKGARAEGVECDAAFYFLRQTSRLDTPDHDRAFPGDTPEDRAANATKLEQIREDLAPMFDFFAGQQQIPREDVAALWTFTVTQRTELAMDKPSQRLPLPIDLMIDPATGHIALPLAPWDKPVEAEAKPRLSEFDGAALSGSLLFETTGPINDATLDAKVYQLGGAQPQLVDMTVTVLKDHQGVALAPTAGRFPEHTSFAVVLGDSLRDAAGQPVAIMPAGHFLMAHASMLRDDGTSKIHAVSTDDATRLEHARTLLAPALHDHILAAWPFTTMTMAQHAADARALAETVGVSPDPGNVQHLTPGAALLDFPFGLGSLVSVGDVYYGTIQSPQFLDPVSRAWRGDGGHSVEDVHFAMTVPKNPKPGPIPVVIFGHGLVTERRFVLALGDALAAKGFAAISIDFPYHGARTYCAKGGPISVVNPTTGQLASLDPCQAGSTCNDLGKCVDASGQGNHLATFGVLPTPIASGAVFQEIDHIASTKDHFKQALVDLGALDRSLRTGAWQAVMGAPVGPIYYTGQSLGGIMGGLFLGTNPDIQRAVLNVPGADLVDLFNNSTFFSAQMDAFFTRNQITRDSYDGYKLLAVARWFLDAVDPQHVGAIAGARKMLIQMATLDEIIPNACTKVLQAVTGAPRKDYVAEHGFLVIPLEPEYWRATADLANYLENPQ